MDTYVNAVEQPRELIAKQGRMMDLMMGCIYNLKPQRDKTTADATIATTGKSRPASR